MRVYLSAGYGRRDEMRTAKEHLEDLGFDVTSTWMDSVEPCDMDGTDPRARSTAESDLLEIDCCEALILFTDTGLTSFGRGGRWVELGYALGLDDVLVCLVGPLQNIFCALADRRFETLDEAANFLASLDSRLYHDDTEGNT